KPALSMAEVAKTHWSLQPIRKPAIPAVRQPGRNPIDAFIRTRLDSAGLSPAPAAEPLVLLRRFHFDLTGIPPTPDEIAAFQKEASIDAEAAIRRTIDRLLASPHYGERWARHWLDVARYADSAGYE